MNALKMTKLSLARQHEVVVLHFAAPPAPRTPV
jgi:hypothetical protein